MAVYLNTKKQEENFIELYNEEYFVDKSEIIALLNKKISTKNKYICITRPRRFGKSSVADMLGAYYSKAVDSKEIFDNLKISRNTNFIENLNKYNVISVSFADVNNNCKSCSEYVDRITALLIEDLKDVFPNIKIKENYAIWDILSELNEKFIFIFDEWDYIFNSNLFLEEQDRFLEFLMKLLKDKPYVALAYMTGILPIKKYSSGSSLNMFDEYTMLNDMIYGEYFGFTENEVEELCKKQNKISFHEISNWYNGYINENGDKLYNPRSVVKALQNVKCISYWTNTGAMDEVKEYLKYNIMEIREDVIEMVSGGVIDITIDEEYRAGQEAPKTKEEIYSAMIILGFLSYYDGYLKIPNKELMKEFEKALKDESFGYVSEIIKDSRKMLNATISGDYETVVKILHDIHNSEIPILQYNNENSLACVMTLAYLSARDTYRIEREEKTGKGYADFTFHPRRKADTAFVVELKKDETVEIAMNQMKEKEYFQKFENEYKNILAVAICYDSKTKEHSCEIERIK
ncbi:AAA family ATPase [Clostridium gasigenes]|uniref:PD-(D/E)XK nuclease superfamily protein n=1 Tax=Clostridium gasigenes TaxID=94869 RepID=A0A1H0UPA7_9CLOT|nr:AAA family ATPase [Clostridium gasigenes]SDP67974.1 PD-(D/E)XK nuclease superfamily protein [Clostridium gasigenes]